MARLARWERCLARPGARLLPLVGDDDRLGVFAGGDRRRRPLARLDISDTRQALGEGRLELRGGAYHQTELGRMAVRREQSGFAAQHRIDLSRQILGADGQLESVTVNVAESPPGRWRHFLSEDEVRAGEAFLCDYLTSSLTQRVTRNWDSDAQARSSGARGNSNERASLHRIAATDRLMRTLNALPAKTQNILFAALIREESLTALGRRFAANPRKGRAVVKRALGELSGLSSPRWSGCV